MRRRRGGFYWTVQYEGEGGLLYCVGNFATRKEALVDVVVNQDNYPPGEGKIIQTR